MFFLDVIFRWNCCLIWHDSCGCYSGPCVGSGFERHQLGQLYLGVSRPISQVDGVFSSIRTYFLTLGGKQEKWQYIVCFVTLLNSPGQQFQRGFSCLVLGCLLKMVYGFWIEDYHQPKHELNRITLTNRPNWRGDCPWRLKLKQNLQKT